MRNEYTAITAAIVFAGCTPNPAVKPSIITECNHAPNSATITISANELSKDPGVTALMHLISAHGVCGTTIDSVSELEQHWIIKARYGLNGTTVTHLLVDKKTFTVSEVPAPAQKPNQSLE